MISKLYIKLNKKTAILYIKLNKKIATIIYYSIWDALDMDFVSSYRVSFLGMTPTYKFEILDVIIYVDG